MGRFISPDNGVDQDADNPQSWNLYPYVRNNPVTHTDEDGRSVQICSNNSFGDQQCQTISDDAYNAAQQASNNGGLTGTSLSNLQNSSSGSGTITDSSGATVGTVQWTPDNPGIQGPQAIQAFGQIGNQGMGAINWFGQQMALNVVGGVAGAGIGMAFDAFKASAAIGEILAKAGSAVGNTSIQVASREAAEQAAKQWEGEGARQIVDRGTGKVVGEISADGTKVARFTSAETKGYINLESKTTGSNLHVRLAMTKTDLDTLKANIDMQVEIETVDGEQLVGKVICVFDDESDADLFFELISTSRPELYKKTEQVGGYSLPLKDIASVNLK